MTREEAKGMLFDAHAEAGVVDAIYDDFESRTCENCKYWDAYKLNVSGECEELSMYTKHYFGCNKFERKTDGDV